MSEHEERLDKHIKSLGEHYDNVQIFCSKLSDDGDGHTISISRGTGNLFARCWHAHQWLARQDETARADARKDQEDD